MKSINTIKSRYYAIAKKLNAPSKHVRFAMTTLDFGEPYIEVHESEYHYVVSERGEECKRQRTKDPDELLYWMVSDITWKMASDWELANREVGKDSRRLLFQRDIDLLEIINVDWADRKRTQYDEVLKSHPFND